MSIYQKLLEARKAMSFEKTTAKDLNYEIYDADTILEMVGNALAAQGVLFVPSMVHVEMHYETRQKEYKGQVTTQYIQHALATVNIKFIDVETGDVLEATTHGSAMDYGDKALGKAQTYAIKYFFVRMFLKGKSDINDEEQIDNAEEAAPEPRQTAKTAPKRSAAPDNGSKTPEVPESELDAHFGPKLTPAVVLAADTFPYQEEWKYHQWQELIKKIKKWNSVFWDAVASLELTEDDVHKALEVESVNDWNGGNAARLWLTLCEFKLAETA
jgi:hypothetical protein